MLISNDLFLSLLACRYKALRQAAGEAGSPSDYQCLAVGLQRTYTQNARQQLLSAYSPGDVVERPASLADAL